jgi:hypothetical protein
MRTFKGLPGIAAFCILVATSPCALAAPPPNVVPSDANLNTAMGKSALAGLTSGTWNTAAGAGALQATTDGDRNTAVGVAALSGNTRGQENNAFGILALAENTTGSDNSAVGNEALRLNTTGWYNAAVGSLALTHNATGDFNTAIGYQALDENRAGSNNAAHGAYALKANDGIDNAAFGAYALFDNVSGIRNVAVGFQAGYAVTGSDNITIGGDNEGKAAEYGVIRLGAKAYQKKAFIAGISGVKTGQATAKAVFIDGNGQLGTIKSSRAYKEDIRPMGSASERLLKLRPVTFRYKEPYDDGSRPVEFGLVAEDVAQVFPELVVNGADGHPETVRYDLIATVMLNEFEKEHAQLEDLRQQVTGMAAVIERLEQERGAAEVR